MIKPVPDKENRLSAKLAEGDAKAFTTLYAACKPGLLKEGARILKSDELAEDVCDEVFLTIWEKPELLANVDSLEAYLLTAVRNRSFTVLKTITRSNAAKAEIVNQFPVHAVATDNYLLEKEYVAFIKNQVAQLPPRAKEVFTLCREEGNSYEQAAALLGISRNAVKGHMVYSIKKLKLSIENAFGVFLVTLLFFIFP